MRCSGVAKTKSRHVQGLFVFLVMCFMIIVVVFSSLLLRVSSLGLSH